MSSAPSRKTASLSAWRISVGRCDTSTTVVPMRFNPASATPSASSPSASRFAFGSSSTTSFGAPYTARASAMRCRWPPDNTAPASPNSVS